MCKAKDEGPRCSYGGRIRKQRADKYMEKVTAKADAEMAKGGKLSAKTKWQVDNARRRMRQADIVRNATPEGVRILTAEKDIEEQRFANLPDGAAGSKARALKSAVQRKINKFQKQIEKGVKDREIMRRNKQILEPGEKKNIRDKMIVQGAEMNVRAQRSTPQTAQAQKNIAADKALVLKEWTESDVKELASHWVEDDTRTGWKENPTARPSTTVKGDKFTPSRSNMLRMNTPDGQVAEVRVDVHSIKTADGKYLVEIRRTSASTNLQSSPYDTTGGELGDIISSKTGVMSRRVQADFQQFNSQAEADNYAKKAQKSISQKMAVDLAVETRASLVKWAAKSGGKENLMKATQPGTHLYSAPSK